MKVMASSANVAYKESQDVLKQFIKSDAKDIGAFSKQFVASRSEYYRKQAVKDMIAQAWLVQIN